MCRSRILSESERTPKKKKASVSFESDTHLQIVKKDAKLRASWNEADQKVMWCICISRMGWSVLGCSSS